MASTERGATRSTERTRRAVLDAAGALLLQQGTGLSVAEVATAAGVSKSGLLHHFPSRDALLLATAADALAALRAEVLDHVDLTENRPGKLLRAYVRALADGSETVRALFGPSLAWQGLQVVPGIDALLQEDAAYWRSSLGADGMPPDRVLVVRLAAEGLAGSLGLPQYVDAGEQEVVRTALLALAEP